MPLSRLYLIMGFIPFIMLLLTLLQYTTVTKTDAMELLMQIFPVSFQRFLEDIVSEIYVKSTTVMSLSVIAAVWACGRGVLAITNGLNSVNGLEETRNYLFRRDPFRILCGDSCSLDCAGAGAFCIRKCSS